MPDTEPTAEALIEQGNELAAANDHAAAAACYERALALDPGFVAAHNNYALSLTALGRLREAWTEGEWRLKVEPRLRQFMERPPLPMWRGESHDDEVIVLWEQGFADILQYLRFLAPLARKVGAVGFLCPPPLRRLVAASFPAIELLSPDRPVRWSDYVAFAPLMSLPHSLAVDEKQLPAEPYFKPPPADRTGRVAIVWRAGEFDVSRGCRLQDLQPLADAGHALVSLQRRPTPEERALLKSWGAEERGSSLQDFFDTATALASVRALVSVDTSAVHVAGGCGVATHVLLNEPASVRWMLGTDVTPWYPSMRLHRKQRADAWQALVRGVADLLRE